MMNSEAAARRTKRVPVRRYLYVTYYVALPFLKTEDGIAAGQAQEMPSASAAIRRAELMSRDPLNAGALAFRRTGNPNSGDFGESSVLKSFGDVPNTLDES
jgi:hypothetical protein